MKWLEEKIPTLILNESIPDNKSTWDLRIFPTATVRERV
jgi:hypothetical protein